MTRVIEFKVTDRSLQQQLRRAATEVGDFTPAMSTVADILRRAVEERFKAEAGPDGVPWTPSQRVLKHGGKTLQIRGRKPGGLLANVLAGKWSDRTSAGIGTNYRYAAIHQFGGIIRAIPKSKGGKGALRTPYGPRGSVQMPARPFLGFSEENRRDITDILRDHLRRVLGGEA